MPQPANNNTQTLQGNCQAGHESAVMREKGKHASTEYRKSARQSQVLLNCI